MYTVYTASTSVWEQKVTGSQIQWERPKNVLAFKRSVCVENHCVMTIFVHILHYVLHMLLAATGADQTSRSPKLSDLYRVNNYYSNPGGYYQFLWVHSIENQSCAIVDGRPLNQTHDDNIKYISLVLMCCRLFWQTYLSFCSGNKTWQRWGLLCIWSVSLSWELFLLTSDFVIFLYCSYIDPTAHASIAPCRYVALIFEDVHNHHTKWQQNMVASIFRSTF